MFVLAIMLCLYNVDVFCGCCGCCANTRTTEPSILFRSDDNKIGKIVGECHDFSNGSGKKLNIVKNEDNIKKSEYHEVIDNIKKDINEVGISGEFINNVKDDYFINDDLVRELNRYHDLVAQIKTINNEMNNLPFIDLSKYTNYYNSLFDKLKDFGNYKVFEFDKNSDSSIILLFIFKKLLRYIDCKKSFTDLFADDLNRYNIYCSYTNKKSNCVPDVNRFNRIGIDENEFNDFSTIIKKAMSDLENLKLNVDSNGNIAKFYVRSNPNGRVYFSKSDIIPMFKDLNIDGLRAEMYGFLRYINQRFRLDYLDVFSVIIPVSVISHMDYDSIPLTYRKLIEQLKCKEVVIRLISANNEINGVISEIDEVLKKRADILNNNSSKIEKCKIELSQIEQSIRNIIADLRKKKSK